MMASAQAVSLWRLLLPLLPGDCIVAAAGAGASAAGTPLNGDGSTGVTVGGPVKTQHSDNPSGNGLNCYSDSLVMLQEFCKLFDVKYTPRAPCNSHSLRKHILLQANL